MNFSLFPVAALSVILWTVAVLPIVRAFIAVLLATLPHTPRERENWS